MDKEKAELARSVGEIWAIVKNSHFGEKLMAKLTSIEEQAVSKAMRGDTPESLNVIMECRGKYAAIAQLRTLFTDVEAEEQSAIKWQTEAIQETPPAEDASTKVE